MKPLRRLVALTLALAVAAPQAGAFAPAAPPPAAPPPAAPPAKSPDGVSRILAIASGAVMGPEETGWVLALLRGAAPGKPVPERQLVLEAPGGWRLSPLGRELLLTFLEGGRRGSSGPLAPAVQPSLEPHADRVARARLTLGALDEAGLRRLFDGEANLPGGETRPPVVFERVRREEVGAGPAAIRRQAAEPPPPPAPAAKPGWWSRFRRSRWATYLAGAGLVYANYVSGAITWLHEQGHQLMSRTLAKGEGSVQVDGVENVKNFGARPSWRNFLRILQKHDVDGNGYGGYSSYSEKEPTALGRKLGPKNGELAVLVAGPVLQGLVGLGGYAAGWSLRKKKPGLAYTLMFGSALQHIASSLYAWEAVALSGSKLAESGGDWARVSTLTGLPPILPALLYTSALPLEAIALRVVAVRHERERQRRVALARLLDRSSVTEADLRALYDSYPRRDRLPLFGRDVQEVLRDSLGLNGTVDLRAREAYKRHGSELSRFQRHVVASNLSLIEAERGQLPRDQRAQPTFLQALRDVRDHYRQRFKEDRVATSLDVATLSAATAVATVGVLHSAATPGRELLPRLLPILGGLGIANGLFRAWRAFKDPALTRTAKALRIGAHLSGVAASTGALIGDPALGLGGLVASGGFMAAEWVYRWLQRRGFVKGGGDGA